MPIQIARADPDRQSYVYTLKTHEMPMSCSLQDRRASMKNLLCRMFPALFLLALPAAALADTSVDSTSIVRLFQDSRPGFARRDLAPATHFLGIDADKLGDGNLSLHFN